MAIIEMQHVYKTYGDITALKDVSFTLKKGIYGLVGPNGAGKTTSMGILTGIILPDSGAVMINGEDLFEEPAKFKSMMGIMLENTPIYEKVSGWDYLKFVAESYGKKFSELDEIKTLVKDLNLSERMSDPIGQYSKGMIRLIGFLTSIVHDPEILILDEPTEGIDAYNRKILRDIIIKEIQKDRTVLLSSHNLWEVEKVCDQIILMFDGKIKYSGSVDELKAKLIGKDFWVSIKLAKFDMEKIKKLAEHDIIKEFKKISKHEIQFLLADKTKLPEFNKLLVLNNIEFLSVTPVTATLEEAFTAVIPKRGGHL
jgi:ABC-type multidrug transport system ATPase subunit